MSKIHLGRGLSFDARELATEVTALYGMRGSGKSNTAAVIVEGCLASKVQVIILDYVGIWPSLRLEPDGKTPSRFSIQVLGGRLGDLALTPGSGRLLAEALAASGSSAVIDVSEFNKADRTRFAADFGERLFECKKDNPGPTLLVLEEAQRYAPQMIRPGMEAQARALGAFEQIGEVGRNYGLGLLLITQRPQKVNVEVRNLAENAFAFRMLGVHEREAVQKYVYEKDIPGREDVKGELPSLPQGTALVWSPVRGIYGKYVLDKKTTYDAGATPLHARKAVKIKPLDLSALEASMSKIIEEAKANDPKTLKAKIAELERALKAKPAAAGKTKTVEVPTVPKKVAEFIGTLPGALIDLVGLAEELRKTAIDIKHEGDRLNAKVLPKVKIADVERPHANGVAMSKLDLANRFSRRIMGTPNDSDVDAGFAFATAPAPGDLKLGSGERAILTACAQHDGGCTRQQLTVLTGYKRSTRDAYIQRLYAKSLITIGDRINTTPAGMAVLGDDFELLPTGAALLAHHLRRLPEGERKILQVVAAKYPAEADREMLTEHTGYKRSTRDAYIQRLAAKELVSADRGPVLASDTLFD